MPNRKSKQFNITQYDIIQVIQSKRIDGYSISRKHIAFDSTTKAHEFNITYKGANKWYTERHTTLNLLQIPQSA
jgi:hypothetical protein